MSENSNDDIIEDMTIRLNISNNRNTSGIEALHRALVDEMMRVMLDKSNRLEGH